MGEPVGSITGKVIPYTPEEQHEENIKITIARLARKVEKLATTGRLGYTYGEIEKQLLAAEDSRSRKNRPGHEPTVKEQLTQLHPTFKRVIEDQLLVILADQAKKELGAELSKQKQNELRAQAIQETAEWLEEEVGILLADNSGQGLRDRMLEVASGIKMLLDDIPNRAELIKNVLEQVKVFKNLEFIKGITASTATVRVTGAGLLESLRPQLIAGYGRLVEIQKEFVEINKIPISTNPKTQKALDERTGKALKDAYAVMAKYFSSVEDIASSTEAAINQMSFDISDKAIDAYIATHNAAKEQIEQVGKFGVAGLKLVEGSMKATNYSGFFVRVMELFNNVTVKVGKEAVIAIGKEKYGEEHTKLMVFAEFDKEPGMFYKRLQENQLDAIELFCNGLGVVMSGGLLAAPPGTGEVVMHAFDLVVTTVQTVVKTVLKDRARRAEELITEMRDRGEIPAKVADKEDPVWGKLSELWGEAFDNVSEELETKLTKAIGEDATKAAVTVKHKLANLKTPTNILGFVYNPGKYPVGEEEGEEGRVELNPIALTTFLVRIIVPPVLGWVMKKFKVKPAEIFTGDQLIGLLDDMFFSQLPVNVMLEVSLAPRVKPTQVDAAKYDEAAQKYPNLLPAAIKGYAVLETNENLSVLDDLDNVSVYVMLLVHGNKVWGRWYPEKIGRASCRERV